MIGPNAPDVNVLPTPEGQKEIELTNALRTFMLSTTDALKYLIQLPTTSVTSAYTATSGDYTILCNATSGAFTVTLPLAKPNTYKVYIIKKTDVSANAVTIDGNGAETIDGATTQSLSSQYATKTLHCDGTEWHITSTT
jgi:hypothetical protein